MSSKDRVNYLVRPNKNIERKLIAEVLVALNAQFPFSQYRYIGMGARWFQDFILMHRALGIRDMISIERDEPDRVEFNRPFACITVEPGDTSRVLPALALERGDCIVWLDHESGLAGPVLADLRFVAERVSSGSVIIATANANVRQIQNQLQDPSTERSPEEALERVAGLLVPNPLPRDGLNRVGFPATVAMIMANAITRALVQGGRSEEYVPLFNFAYEDGAPMATVGGILLNTEDRSKFDAVDLSAFEFTSATPGAPYRINVPNLTPREKMRLDRLLPGTGSLTVKQVQDELRFPMEQSQLEAYSRFYRQYPLFSEVFG